ncbi:MAG: hypothetical protein QOI84_107, partial [Solirubrobacterales bacterium]|nr:hypothetical protein [Solirubrobacterales bacterium]
GPALTPAPASASVSGEGEYPSGDFEPASPGEYRWSAHFVDDVDSSTADSECSAGSTVAKATPGMTGNASGGVVGTNIHDEVTLTEAFSPTGEVTFSVFGPADTGCATALETTTAPIQSAVATSVDFLAQEAGEFRWTAEYPGDANNEPVSLACTAANQTSLVDKASPTLTGVATSAQVGQSITDNATLSGGFSPGGHLVFRAYGPGDETCGTAAEIYEAVVVVSGNGSYSPTGFVPPLGLYRWTVEYEEDANNKSAETVCGAANQSSAVGTVAVTLTAAATGGTVGNPVSATATIAQGAIPGGQITFRAFSPGDANCAGTAAFSSTVNVSGNGSYGSAAFVPSRVGNYRWTVDYSGDVNHVPATAGCGKATSTVSQARPSIAGGVRQRVPVGTSFRDTATIQGAYAPTGTVTFRIYGPVSAGCAKPVFVDTVAVTGNGTVRSDPFVTQRPGRYSFVASYSGDARNQGATEPCDSVGQAALVQKRQPKVQPRARLIGGKRISIRAHLAGGASPSGVINFRLYGPGDKRCKGKPAFSGGITVRSNGSYSIAEYLATEKGIYRLKVGYSGDQRNRPYKSSCSGAQPIRVG